MSISNGQIANATNFNNAFVSKTATTGNTVTGIVEMANVSEPLSGVAFTNAQQYINEIADSDGTIGQADATRKTYSSSTVVTTGDSRKTAVGKLDARFHGTTGHTHTGVAGEGPQVSALDAISEFNKYFAAYQAVDITSAVGTTFDVTSYFSTETPGGDTAVVGVVTSAPNNRGQILSTSTLTYIEDAQGQRVYSKLTESTGTWTLSFYTNEAGVETAHSLSSQNITLRYLKVFDAETRPTFSADLGLYESLDLTADVADASTTVSGKVNTSAQSFAGLKYFTSGLKLSASFESPKTDVASGGTVTALTYSPFINFTGASTTTVQGLASGTDGKRIVIHNSSSGTLTIEDENAGASAANRFHLPGGNPLSVSQDSSTEFIYDTGISRWVIQSASAAAAGTDRQVQFNDGGAFGASNALVVTTDDQVQFLDAQVFFNPLEPTTFWGSGQPSIRIDSEQFPGDETNLFTIASTDTVVDATNTTDVGILSGDNNATGGTGNTGTVWVSSGYQNQSASTGRSGALYIGSGYVAGSGDSGVVSVTSGPAETGSTGYVNLISGDIYDSGATGLTGPAALASGNNAGSGASGNTTANTGNTQTGGSGTMAFTTGNVQNAGATAASGELRFFSGNNSGLGNSGAVRFKAGTVTTGVRGYIQADGKYFVFADPSLPGPSSIGNGSIILGTPDAGQTIGVNAVILNGSVTSNAASGIDSFSAGHGTYAQGYGQFVLGRYNVLQGTSGSNVQTDDAFVIGNGTSTGARANAYSVSRDGKVRTQREVYLPDSTQTLAATFTIAPNKTYCPISSAGNVTSHATTAISDGSETGQQLIIENRGSFVITLKNAANTKLPGAADFNITANSTMTFIWNGTDWVTTASSAN